MSGETAFSPKYIRSQVSKHFSYITDGSQHDSHEFFVSFVSYHDDQTLFLQILEEEQNKALNADRSPFFSISFLPFDTSYSFFNSDSLPFILEQNKEWWSIYKEHNPNFLTNVYYGVQSTISTCQHCHLVSVFAVSSFF